MVDRDRHQSRGDAVFRDQHRPHDRDCACNSGGFAALAAIVWASWNGNAAPSTGDDWLIISFAVAIIGGTGLKGSQMISPVGILMGAIIFKLIQHSLVILKINDNYSNTLLGGLILLAIVVDRAREHFGGKEKQG